MNGTFHVPVMGQEVCECLITQKDGIYIDCTLGGGGHSELVLQRLSPSATLIAIDRDADALRFAQKRLTRFKNIIFYRGLYSDFEEVLEQKQIDLVNGVLLDLGVSSFQLDSGERGFAFRPGLKLDMRMDQEQVLTAETIVNTYSEKQLVDIFKNYGEERFARNIAWKIIRMRDKQPLTATDDLMDVIERSVPGRYLTKSFARIFQALRIEVNQELETLQTALNKMIDYLKPGARMVVITYHSLEDRIVKNFFREQEEPCICPPQAVRCVCGRKPKMVRLKPRFRTPGEDEILRNPRARSAKLRAGERV